MIKPGIWASFAYVLGCVWMYVLASTYMSLKLGEIRDSRMSQRIPLSGSTPAGSMVQVMPWA